MANPEQMTRTQYGQHSPGPTDRDYFPSFHLAKIRFETNQEMPEKQSDVQYGDRGR